MNSISKFDHFILFHLHKFDHLRAMIEGKDDILVVTETKLDSTFPTNKFYINGFTKPYRRNRNRNGRGVLIYIREDVPSKELDNHLPNAIEGMFIEVNLKKSERLLFRYYHSLSQSDTIFSTRFRTIWIN